MAKRSTAIADLQAEIYRRRYPEHFWVNWFVRVRWLDVSHDNIRRCLAQNPVPADREALEWLRGELLAIQGAKKPKKQEAQLELDLGASLKPFYLHLPRKPFCTDDLEAGLQVRPLGIAINRRYIQPNGSGMVWTVPIDVDSDIAEQARSATWSMPCAEPDAIVLNRENGHGHLLWYLAAGVCTTSAARQKPMRWLAAVQQGLRQVVGGDLGYSGLITKTPWHKDWEVVERHDRLYSLAELADGLDLSAANARKFAPKASEAYGVGRNVTLFDQTRHWAYGAIREYWAPNGLPKWQDAVLGHVETLNEQFQESLPYSETKAIAKSIAKWTWNRITPEGLRELIERTHSPEKQRERGIASGKARRASREQERATARLMAAQGHSTRQIELELGVDHVTVWRWLR